MAKVKSKTKSKAKHIQRALNAFEKAEAEEQRDQSYDDLGLSGGSDLGSDGDDRDAEVEDEEIDSDEAMGSSDDEEVLSSRRQKKGNATEADDEGYSSVDESQLVSLSQAWDMDSKDAEGEDENKEDEEEGPKLTFKDDDEEEEVGSQNESAEELSGEESEDSESEDSENDEDEDDLDFPDSDEGSVDFDDVDEEKLSNLRSLISNMSADASESARIAAKSRKRLETVNAKEGEFSIPASSTKLSLSDLVSSVSDQKSQESLTLLKGQETKSAQKTALAVPLPKRLQDRLDRKAAYDLAKEEVDKWSEVVKSNREAEHLQFPINPEPQVIKTTVTTALTPSTDLEKKIDNILVESTLKDEKAISTFEELASSKLSMEELRKRRNELRLMRDLMLREESKAKRLKKIKSKSYRRIHKKERERNRQLVDSEEEDVDSLEASRAQERMSLKHKSNSKWAKSMVNQGLSKDKDVRDEIEGMLRRGESLRQKIRGADEQDSETELNDDKEFLREGIEDEEEKSIKDSSRSGLLGMKFMVEAEKLAKENNKRTMELLHKELNNDGFDDEEEKENTSSANQIINGGRRVYAPGTSESFEEVKVAVKQAKKDHQEDVERGLTSRLASANDGKGEGSKKVEARAEESNEEESNPWLALGNAPVKRNAKIETVDKNSSTLSKNQDKIRKQKSSLTVREADNIIIDMNETLKVVDAVGEDDDSDGESSPVEGPGGMIKTSSKQLLFQQKELVKRAFAGDDVVTEFQEEKRQKIKEEGDQEVDVTLPGWGSWTGEGVKTKKRVTKIVKGVAGKKRKDSKLQNVVINERINKKNSKYTAGSVPFPFENREQYERSLRMPVGQEWTTRETHQTLTKPRVIVKPGKVIDPLQAPFK